MSRVDVFFVLGCILILSILSIRATAGIDLTDEMQYYGQITGLIDAGVLFSNDLFLQQLVYLLFYPFFLFHNIFFGNNGLVLFGRLILAIISFGIFIFSYNKFKYYKANSLVACCGAIALTFAIPYHGIFALSYNTVSQALWIVFLFRYYDWKKQWFWIFNILIVLMLLTHQTSAVVMFLLVYGRLLVTKSLLLMFYQIAMLLLLCVPILFLLYHFTSIPDLIASLVFTGDHAVGTGFFSSHTGIIVFSAIALGLTFVLVVGKNFRRTPSGWVSVLALLTVNVLLLSGQFRSYGVRTVYVLASLFLVFAWATKLKLLSLCVENINDSNENGKELTWIVIAVYIYALTLAVTSGNGLGQATGSFMVAVAFMYPLSSLEASSSAHKLFAPHIASSFLLLFLYISFWTLSPYREVSWIRSNSLITDVPEFRFIRTSEERKQFISQLRASLAEDMAGRPALIVSDYPALYFISGAIPETCQLYMHSMGGVAAREQLRDCLNKKEPDFVLDVFTDKDIAKPNSMIKRLAHDYYDTPDYVCSQKLLHYESHLVNNPREFRYTLCRHVAPRSAGY